MSCQRAVSPKGARKLHDADVVYLYDGSFAGFLCCVFESFAQHELPFAVWTPQRETATLYPVKEISTDPAIARRVFASFGKKLGAETEYLVSRDFLSGREDKELLLIRFLHLAFALGPGTVKRRGHPEVAPLYQMKQSLDWEVDKFQGFVRFEEHDGMLGAVIHPKNLYPPPAAPALLRTLSGGGLYDLRCRPSGGAAARKSAAPGCWNWQRLWSCRRPARGSSSFRRCGRSFTGHWKFRPGTTKKAA